MYTCVCLFSSIIFIFYQCSSFPGTTYKLFLVINHISKRDLWCESVHATSNSHCFKLLMCLQTFPEITHTNTWRKTNERSWLHHTHLLQEKCTCPEWQKLVSTSAKGREISACCHHIWQLKHEQRPEEHARLWYTASVFLKIFWSGFVCFLAPWSCPVHCCSTPQQQRTLHQGSRAAAHQRHHAAPLLCCKGPEWSPSKLSFYCISCTFSRCCLETANQRTDFCPKTGVTGVRRMALPRRDVLFAQNWTSTLCKTLLMQDRGHTFLILNSLMMTHMKSVRAPVTLWRLQITLCYEPSDSPGWCNTDAPCLSPSSSATWLGSSHVGCPQRSRYDPLQDYSYTTTIRARGFNPTQIFHRWPEREESLTANHPTSSFKTQQDSTPGWRAGLQSDWSSYLFV